MDTYVQPLGFYSRILFVYVVHGQKSSKNRIKIALDQLELPIGCKLGRDDDHAIACMMYWQATHAAVPRLRDTIWATLAPALMVHSARARANSSIHPDEGMTTQ